MRSQVVHEPTTLLLEEFSLLNVVLSKGRKGKKEKERNAKERERKRGGGRMVRGKERKRTKERQTSPLTFSVGFSWLLEKASFFIALESAT